MSCARKAGGGVLGGVGGAACRIRCGCRGGVALGPEQQLHHLQCRALLCGVVQRQLSILLRNAVKATLGGGQGLRARQHKQAQE